MPTFVALEANTDHPRNEAIPRAVAVLGSEGGNVTGTEALGGLALMFRIELPCEAARSLDVRLGREGIRLVLDSRDALERAVHAEDEVVGSLLLRFFAHEPDLKIEIPKVPGE